MDKTKISGNNGIELPPLRSLDDFILESARFQIPNFKDLDKWGNRVVQNLLYYQTNYCLLSIIIFLLVGILHPGKMLLGMVAMTVVVGIFIYGSTEGRAIHNFKKQNPLAGVIIVLLGGCFVTYTLGSLLVFFIGILTPFSVIFVHASMRLRNLKNKLANKIEGIGLKRTPMGLLLEYFDDSLTQWCMKLDDYDSYVKCINSQNKYLMCQNRSDDVTGMNLRIRPSITLKPSD